MDLSKSLLHVDGFAYINFLNNEDTEHKSDKIWWNMNG